MLDGMTVTASKTAELDCEVLIVGGGLVGLTLCIALAGAGVSTILVDRETNDVSTAPAFDGRASAIAAGSRDVLATLGVWDLIVEDGAPAAEPILEIRVSDGASPLFLHYDYREINQGPLGYIVENRLTRLALMHRVVDLEDAKLLQGRIVETLHRDPDRAQAMLDDGMVISAGLVIAADGRNSPIRREAGIGQTQWDYGQSGIVCTIAHERPHRGVAQEHFLPAGPFAILPMTGNRSSLVWTEQSDLAPRILALDDQAFADELSLRFGDYLGELTPVGPKFCYPLSLVHADSYIDSRLALAGDSAHGMHPIAGQGFNLGLRDVAALAEVIVDAMRLGLDPGTRNVLERYQRWRHFDTVAMLAVTDALNRLFSNDVAPVRMARDIGLAAVNQAPPLKKLFMRHAMGRVGDLPRLARGQKL
jgi:2-octaprenyl-6-methoxyphenol hydroxylase